MSKGGIWEDRQGLEDLKQWIKKGTKYLEVVMYTRIC